ncbi:hypothetical protein AYK26_05800 [Euryarchaeota archaeon SM23-78]|nr:MAG: hypothetical protein AYK26_05800 [Euryarchaeota archaeon SM23-78]MBW3001430.1 thioredoxin [Candidatus Woesearchaeota archaeon]
MITELNQENFEEKTKKGKAIIDFYAEWCGPCHIIKPILEKMSTENKDIDFYEINVDNNQKAASIYVVRSIPTLIFLKNGKEVHRVIGVLQEDEFKEKIEEVFK